jgi:hypothetical protein
MGKHRTAQYTVCQPLSALAVPPVSPAITDHTQCRRHHCKARLPVPLDRHSLHRPGLVRGLAARSIENEQGIQQCLVTIAVADADDHAQGMLRSRLARCVRPFHVQASALRAHISVHSEVEALYIFPNSDLDVAGNRVKGTLNTQAWMLQELLLSPRVICFGNRELYWDCVTVSASESSPISASLLHDANPDETWALKLICKTLAGSKAADVLRLRIAESLDANNKNCSAQELTR